MESELIKTLRELMELYKEKIKIKDEMIKILEHRNIRLEQELSTEKYFSSTLEGAHTVGPGVTNARGFGAGGNGSGKVVK